MRVIYGDLFLGINLVVNLVLLYAAGRVAGEQTPWWRLITAAACGSFYALAYLVSGQGWMFSPWAVLAFPLLMAAIAFAPLPPGRFSRVFGAFYAGSFLAAGMGTALTIFGRQYPGLASRLTRPRWWMYVLVLAAVLVLARAIHHYIQLKRERDLGYVTVEISCGGETVLVQALVDSGNQLRDPLSGAPVIVATYQSIFKLLPVEVREVYRGSSPGALRDLMRVLPQTSWASRFRIIPFLSLGKEDGMMPAFKPESVFIYTGQEQHDPGRVIVAITSSSLAADGHFGAIVPSSLTTALQSGQPDPQAEPTARRQAH